MRKNILRISTILITLMLCATVLSGCISLSRYYSSPEDEILGTWEWTHDIDFGEDIGTVHNFSKYVFEKKDGKYFATLTFSGFSSPITIEYSYEIKDSKLILTYLSDNSKVTSHDLVIKKDSLKIGEKEYKRISK